MNNILQISTVAEKHTATKLQEQCCSFILGNIDAISPQLLDDLAKALPFQLEVMCRAERLAPGIGNRNSLIDLSALIESIHNLLLTGGRVSRPDSSLGMCLTD